MSGPKQHFIPQQILRRFGSERPRKGKLQVCVYTPDRTFVTATDGIAAQRFFYSESSDTGSLDDRITRHENTLKCDLSVLDLVSENGLAPPDESARVITHLIVRSGHTRQMFTQVGQMVAGEGLDLFKDKVWLQRALGLDGEEPSEAMKALIREEMASIPEGKMLLSLPGMEQVLQNKLKSLLQQQQPVIASAVSEVQRKMARELPDRMRTAHTKSLGESLSPEARMALLAPLTWTVESVTGEDLILPDCVALAKMTGADELVPAIFLSKARGVDAVYMPLGPRKVLVGSTGAKYVPQSWNEEAARASVEFFISNARDPKLEKHSPLIGSTVQQMLDHDLRSAFAEDPTDLFARPARSDR